MTRPVYVAGLDLGQSNDPTALVIARVELDAAGEKRYYVGHVERLPLGTRYPAVVAHVGATVAALRSREPAPDVHLAIDGTGVGKPVVDMFLAKRPDVATLCPVTITGADAVTDDPTGGVRVPKRDLASTVLVLLESGRLEIARNLPLAEALTAELVGFRVKISLATGHDSYGAGEDWRSAPHDDLVLALAMAVWYGEHRLLLGNVVLNDRPSDWDDDSPIRDATRRLAWQWQ